MEKKRARSLRSDKPCALWRHRRTDACSEFPQSRRTSAHLPRSSTMFSISYIVPSRDLTWSCFCQDWSNGRQDSVGNHRRSANKGGIHMRQRVCVLISILTCATAVVAIPITGHAEETIQRTVQGTVVATNVGVDPSTIVVKVLLPNKEVLIVGARVLSDTRITRGKQAVRLSEVKTGEKAELMYLKAPDGLIARSIHVR